MSLHRKCLVASFLVVLLGGCTQIQSGAPNSSQELGAQQPSEALESKLRKGMPYADFRKAVVDSGWAPVIDPECKPNVVGGDYAKTCAAKPEPDDCRACDDLPELSACSGDGYCGMTFSSDGEGLGVTTYGMIEDRAVSGESSRLEVMGWKFEGRSAR